jgi:hypothetical protein
VVVMLGAVCAKLGIHHIDNTKSVIIGKTK